MCTSKKKLFSFLPKFVYKPSFHPRLTENCQQQRKEKRVRVLSLDKESCGNNFKSELINTCVPDIQLKKCNIVNSIKLWVLPEVGVNHFQEYLYIFTSYLCISKQYACIFFIVGNLWSLINGNLFLCLSSEPVEK